MLSQLASIEASGTDTGVGFQYTLQSPIDDVSVPRPMWEQGSSTMASIESGTYQADQNVRLPPVAKAREARQVINSIPNEIWEGTVQSIDTNARIMSAIMEPMLQKNISRHSASISLDYVVQQDLPLVRPGAVFYLTIFTERKRTSIQNAEEIRFRRMPAWSKVHIKKIQEDAAVLLDCIEG